MYCVQNTTHLLKCYNYLVIEYVYKYGDICQEIELSTCNSYLR